jgi:hypothetical protein
MALTLQMKMPPKKGVLTFNYMNYRNLRVKGVWGGEITNANGTPTAGRAHARDREMEGGGV